MQLEFNHKDSLRSIAELFTPSAIDKIVRSNNQKPAQLKIKKHIKDISNHSFGSLLSKAYRELEKNYRNEYVFKNHVFNDLIVEEYAQETSTVLNEFRIGSSIADIVLLNGEIKVYEIKTDLDKLDKLDKQLADYRKFADKVFIVASDKHIKTLEEKYHNSEIGLIKLTSENKLKTVKAARSNIKSLDHTTIFKTLRKNEYLEIVANFFGEVPKVPNTLIFKECLASIKQTKEKVFQEAVLKILKKRKSNNFCQVISNNTPYELKYICYSLDFNKNEYLNLHKFLNRKL